jgi:hypothetical protein
VSAPTIFLSHTGTMARLPAGRSFVAAVLDAVAEACHVPHDMRYFTADERTPAAVCEAAVRDCGVYIGIFGLDYGSPVRDRPDISYTELEFLTALEEKQRRGLPVFVFLLAETVETQGLGPLDPRQAKFRQRVRDSGITAAPPFATPDGLQHIVYRTLMERLPQSMRARPCHLPYRSLGEMFIGREPFLRDLRERFDKARRQQRWPNQTIHGLGGVGKTRTAVEYAWRHADDYSALLFVSGDSPERLHSSLAGLSGALQLNLDEKATDPQRIQAVHAWLAAHPGWLLIVDNVDDRKAGEAVAALLPRWHAGHVLITGRWRRWSQDVEPLDLHVLAPDDAVHFLLAGTENARTTDADDPAEAQALACDDLAA